MKQQLIEVLRSGFALPTGVRPVVLVVGDLMLDRYLWGDVERISPEAPVPVIRLKSESVRLGGAANVSANLSGLGLVTHLIGYLGADIEAQAMRALCQQHNIETQGLVVTPEMPTISKTRVMSGHQQLLRMDREEISAYPTDAVAQLMSKALETLDQLAVKAIVLSDYAKGVLTAEVCQTLIMAARHRHIPVLVDPKGRDYMKYRGATTLTPNRKEAAELNGVNLHDTESILRAAGEMQVTLSLDFMTITRGEEGISLILPGTDHLNQCAKAPLPIQHIHLPATAQQVFDVSGAGDTVIATMAAGLAVGMTPVMATELANVAAGIVVGKVGTVAIDQQSLVHALEVEEAIEQADKICTHETLTKRVQGWKNQGLRIVFTNGCFDLLHTGHVTYLEQARKLGDRLVLGINTDRSVQALKGPTRPVIHEVDRARVLAALESVDAVILFDEETPLGLIETIRPDILVKGSDYSEDQVVGGQEVINWGGRVALIDFVQGHSTTGIIKTLSAN